MNRLPPQALDAEESVLGSCLLDYEAFERIKDTLKADNFYKERHRIVFRHLVSLYDSGQPLDLVAITDALRSKGQLEQIGGTPYLIGLMDSVPTAAYVETYAGIVKEKAQLRELIAISGQAMQAAYDAQDEVANLINHFQDVLAQLATAGKTKDFYSALELSNRFIQNFELRKTTPSANALPTGFRSLDKFMTGFKNGKLYVLASRPAMGKSALAVSMAANVAKLGAGIGFFSLEMEADEIWERMVSAESKIAAERIAKPNLMQNSEYGRMTDLLGRLSEQTFFINDDVTLDVDQIKAATRKLMTQVRLDLIVVDYTQLLRGKGGNRQEEVSNISRSLKIMARELDLPVLILSQLSRDVEKRADKRPILSDLRDSGAIEQDADVVMFIYRDEYYDPQTIRPGIAEIIFAKQRGGPTGTAELTFIDKHVRFEELIKDLGANPYAN